MRLTVTYTCCFLATWASAKSLQHARGLSPSLNPSSNATASGTPRFSLSSPTRLSSSVAPNPQTSTYISSTSQDMSISVHSSPSSQASSNNATLSQPSSTSLQSLVQTTQTSNSGPTSVPSLISPSGSTTRTNSLPSSSSQSSGPAITSSPSSQPITTAPPPPSTTYAAAVVSSVTSQAAGASAAAVTFQQAPTLQNAQNAQKKINDALTGMWLPSFPRQEAGRALMGNSGTLAGRRRPFVHQSHQCLEICPVKCHRGCK